jgi:hypothetical protein
MFCPREVSREPPSTSAASRRGAHGTGDSALVDAMSNVGATATDTTVAKAPSGSVVYSNDTPLSATDKCRSGA